MALLVNNQKIIPAPLVTLNKTENRTGDGRPISTNFRISLRGTLLPNQGSPTSSGTFWNSSGYPGEENYTLSSDKFNSLLAKQEALKELFITPGSILEYGPDTGDPAIIANVRLIDINFDEGQWVDRCDYTINLEAHAQERQGSDSDNSYDEFTDKYINQASNTIQIAESEDGQNNYIISHNISAVGFTAYDNPNSFVNNKEPWENAKDWVVTKINDPIVSYILDTTGKTKYNQRKTENIDKLAGSYALTINYTITNDDGNAINNYEISTQTTRSQIDDLNTGQSLQVTHTINGTITGLDENYDIENRVATALAEFVSFESTIPTLLGLNSDHLFVTKSVNKNYINGSVVYSITYTDFPSANYTHTYTVNDNKNSNSLSVVTISGNIQAYTVDGSVSTTYANAQSAWAIIKTELQSLAESSCGVNLKEHPSNLNIGFNKSTGLITYSANFDYLDSDNPYTANYLDQYDVSVQDSNINNPNNRNNNAIATISGSIIGYDINGDTQTKFDNALARYNSIKTSIKDRLSTILGTTVQSKILSRSESFNKFSGSVSYSFSFPLNDEIEDENIINQEITIEYDRPIQVTAVQIIPGKDTGPIIQNIGTTTQETKTLSVNLVLGESTTESYAESYFTTIKNQYLPSKSPYYVNGDKSSYNRVAGTYQRSISWIYNGS